MTKRSRTVPFKQRFQAWLEPADNGCIVWTGARNARGYGRVSTATIPNLPKVTYAHRVAYYLATGETPALLRHTCDNPPCCNPDHLLPGTQQDNMRDAVERGRIKIEFSVNEAGHPYNHCGCADCTEFRRARSRASSTRRRWAGAPPHSVGSENYYRNFGCRCDLCRVAVFGPNVRPRRSYPTRTMSLRTSTTTENTTP